MIAETPTSSKDFAKSKTDMFDFFTHPSTITLLFFASMPIAILLGKCLHAFFTNWGSLNAIVPKIIL